MTKKFQFVLVFVLIMVTLIIFLCVGTSRLFANEGNILEWDDLTGDWWGAKPFLSDQGLDFEFYYTGEIISTVSGGIQQKTRYLDSFDLILSMDMKKLVNWSGARILVYGLGINGKQPSLTDIGDIQTVSNIETLKDWKLFEAWLEQNLWGNRISLLVGIHDLNAEFDSIDTAQLFIQSSHGMGAEFGQIGPSSFPQTTLGGRIRFQPLPYFYIQSAAYDGKTGPDTNNPFASQMGLQIHFSDSDGVLIANETALLLGSEKGKMKDFYRGKYALGAWFHTGDFEHNLWTDPNDDPIIKNNNMGVYGFIDQQIFREDDDPYQGLSVFTRVGWARPELNEIGFYTGGGLVYVGPFPTRDLDQIGFAIAAVHASNDFQQAEASNGIFLKDTEIDFEFSYRAQIFPWLALQPNFHYVTNPSFSSILKDAFVIGTRWEIAVW